MSAPAILTESGTARPDRSLKYFLAARSAKQNALAALAQLPETADQRRLRLLAHEMAKLQRRLGQLELANAWLVQVLQHFVEDAAGTDRVNADQLREDWNKLAEAFRNLSDETLAQPAEPGPA